VCACVFERVREILCVREYVRVSMRECVGRCVKMIYSLLHLECHSISISNLNFKSQSRGSLLKESWHLIDVFFITP